MRVRGIAWCVVTLLVFGCVLIQPVHGDGPKATMYQRLAKQAVNVVQSRNLAQAKEAVSPSRIVGQLFGWEGIVVAAAYPAEVLLYDQVLDTLVQDAATETAGFELRAKTPDLLVVHLTYGADCEVPPQDLLHKKDLAETGAEISPLLYFPKDCWIRQVDLGIPRTRADVYVTVRVREKATQHEGELFLFLSLSLAEGKPGHFHWNRLAKTQRFISESEKAAAHSSGEENKSGPRG
jgi:hypothetical protein